MSEAEKEVTIADLEKRIAKLEKQMPKKKVSIIVFSGDLDRVLASFIIATGAVAMGLESSMFFTFWGLSVLRKQKKYAGKKFINKLTTLLSPGGPQDLPLSQMHFFGLGTQMMKKHMANMNIASLEELIKLAQELGVKMTACEMSKTMMDYDESEILEGVEIGGVGTFLAEAMDSRTALFI